MVARRLEAGMDNRWIIKMVGQRAKHQTTIKQIKVVESLVIFVVN